MEAAPSATATIKTVVIGCILAPGREGKNGNPGGYSKPTIRKIHAHTVNLSLFRNP